MRSRFGLLLAAVAAASCGPEPDDIARAWLDGGARLDAGADASLEGESGPPPPDDANQGEVTRIKARGDVPLVGDRVDAKPDDFLLANEHAVAVVSAKGSIVDFGPKGGVDALKGIEPTVFGSLSAEKLEPPTFTIEAGGHALHWTRKLGEKGRFDAFAFFRGDVLFVESLVTVKGQEPLLAQTLGEETSWGNVPTWVEGLGFVSQGGVYATDFIARQSLGVSYALESTDGHTIARVGGLESNGFHDSPNTGDRTVTVLPNSSSPRRRIAISYSTRSLGDAALALPSFGQKSTQSIDVPPGVPLGTSIEIAECSHDEPPQPKKAVGPLVTRFSCDEGRASARIPEGCHAARFTRPGFTPGPWTPAFDLASKKLGSLLPASGTLHFTVHEQGKAGLMPARVLVRGEHGTPDPDWGDDPLDGAVLDTIYSTGEGQFPLPPGRYTALVQRGFEYTAVEKSIDIKAEKTVELDVSLERVVDTKGWISADCHVHAMPSPDAPSPLEDRVKSLAASGVEVAVATDHNKVTDYGPVIRALHLEKQMTNLIGDEITTHEPSYGHFNTFPLARGAEPVPWEKTTPEAIFSAARLEGPPGIVPIVQLNHPRMGSIGYFELLRFDDRDVARWKARSNAASLDFEAMEVFNGDHYDHIKKVEEVMKDWYALLKAGFKETATGNSDSHKLTFAEAGVPRNFVRVDDDDPASLDPKAFVAAIRAGRVVVSSGPFVRLTVDGHEIGDEVEAGEHEIDVRVDAAPWVDVDKVELVVKGEVVETWTGPFTTTSKRFEKKVKHRLESGDFVLAVARGSKSMRFLHRSGAKPFGFTNPVFVR